MGHLGVALLFLTLGQGGAPEDTLQVRREARDAQEHFERIRRRHLPMLFTAYARCDVRAGNHCYWYDEAEPPPPPEPPATTAARAELLARLGELAGTRPEDGWIAAQRVRYWAEHGEPDSSLSAARNCRAEGWWCAALSGYAHHAAGRYQASEAAFDRALLAMPDEDRCHWNNLEDLLEGDLHGEYKQLSCAARDSANRVIFWLARPRFRVAGNDVLTAWYARNTLVRALEGAITHHGSRLSAGHRELILRYGWETGWSRRQPQPGSHDISGVVGHEPKPAYAFLPQHPPGDDFAWNLRRKEPRARFAPAWTSRVVVPRAVTTRFERGDSLLLVVAFETPADADTLFHGAATAVLALSAGPGAEDVTADRAAPRGRGGIAAQARGRSLLASLEISDAVGGAVALERFLVVTPPASAVRLSELLLFEPGTELPADPIEASATAWSGSPLTAGGRVGLYWEVYGIAPETDSILVTVAVDEAGPGFITRIGRVLGLGRHPPPMRLAWRGQDGAGEAVELDLRLLEPGRYRIRVTAEVAGHPSAHAERLVELVGR